MTQGSFEGQASVVLTSSGIFGFPPVARLLYTQADWLATPRWMHCSQQFTSTTD